MDSGIKIRKYHSRRCRFIFINTLSFVLGLKIEPFFSIQNPGLYFECCIASVPMYVFGRSFSVIQLDHLHPDTVDYLSEIEMAELTTRILMMLLAANRSEGWKRECHNLSTFSVYIASCKHEEGWENSRQLRKPETYNFREFSQPSE